MSLYFSKDDINNLEHDTRSNLINSISGVKPANLIGTVDAEGNENLAIFNSVIHLGSHPALLGFIVRPQGRAERDTYNNIMQTGFFSINAVPSDKHLEAHQTSARFAPNISEFQVCGFTPDYIEDFKAPFVQESPIKIGLMFANKMTIEENKTELIIGKVVSLQLEMQQLPEVGHLNLAELNTTGTSGLNSYYELIFKETLPNQSRSMFDLSKFDK